MADIEIRSVPQCSKGAAMGTSGSVLGKAGQGRGKAAANDHVASAVPRPPFPTNPISVRRGLSSAGAGRQGQLKITSRLVRRASCSSRVPDQTPKNLNHPHAL